MILKELNLIGFGKFKNKNIKLKEGINLIYGENEAGKSTIHSFIHGMFYGFLKPNVRTAQYIEEHEKYNPWDKSRYAGVLSFQYEDKQYRIERDFTKGKERTRVFDENTGEDITNKIENGPCRVLQPGFHFFGFNTRVFSNTISIKQLGSKTEKDLAQEVIEKLINVSQSLVDDISIDKAISELKDRMAEIGTERAPTKPYARNLKAIEELKEEKEKIILEKDKYELYLEDKERLNRELLDEENKLKDLKKLLRKIDTYEKAKKLKEAKEIQGHIESLEKTMDELSIYSKLSMEEYKEAINLTNSIEFLKKDLKENELKLKETKEKLKSLEEIVKNTNINSLYAITKDYEYYEKLEEERNTIVYSKDDNSLEFLKRDYKEHNKNISKYKGIQIFSIIFTIISLGLIILIPATRFYLPVFAVVSLISGTYFRVKVKKFNDILKGINNKILEIEEKEKRRKDRLEEIEKIQHNILKKYDISSKLEFKRLFDRLQFEQISREKNIHLYDELNKAIKSLMDNINKIKLNLDDNSIRLKAIFEKNNVGSIDEFSNALEKKNQYEKLVKELGSKRELLIKVLGQSTIESLILELENEDVDESIKEVNKEQLMEEINGCTERISNYRIVLSRVEENINILGEKISRLVEIEEELERRKVYKEKLETEYKALELAANTIEEISKEIHNEFAPDINNKVSKLIEKITNGKYNKIRIDENLNITVENPATKELININDLSCGTIDQLYFSLRFCLINSMTENSFPLILDDCFIQYDDNRLRNILEFLAGISNNRQIILFTCHNREKKFLEEIDVNFNFIHLT